MDRRDERRRIERLCRTEFGESPVRFTPIQEGNRKRTIRVELAGGRDIVVQFGDARLVDEVTLGRAITARTDVPVPTVLASGECGGSTYFVTAYVPGTNLHEVVTGLPGDQQRRLVEALARHLGGLHHAFRFDGHGDLTTRDGTLVVAEPLMWRPYLDRLLEAGLAAFPEELAELRAEVAAATDPTDVPQEATARLYPWDYRPGNVIVEDGRIAGIVDWGDPRAAGRALSVAKAEYTLIDWYELERFRSDFHAAYASVFPLDTTPAERRFCRIVAIVRSAVDSLGRVTRPKYPMTDEGTAVEFHRERLRRVL